ncbi:MAG TPA: lysylphosphatidylglycerol synthase transmembrane domain-containing protein [Vicinamibacterales bacterium]|nr:lysylphosphatidylglycerol synthase transmembrane domain-containing protein [Vicinamibacterales bacterium]
MAAAKLVVSGGLLAILISRVDVGRVWTHARHASIAWLVAALALYFGMVLVSAWRWRALLHAQLVNIGFRRLTGSFLVAFFYNNFLPSNIGGDVIRIADTAADAGSKTLATTVVLTDRGIGLLGLGFIAALSASAAAREASMAGPIGPATLWGGLGLATLACTPALLDPERLLRLLAPLRRLHPQWIDDRLERLQAALQRFRARPGSLARCFAGAVTVQILLVLFYLAIARSMNVGVTATQLGLLVPISLLVQMLPVSINGFGVREATFGFYFARFHLPLEAALAISFMGAALTMLFSLSGGVVQIVRRR